MFVIYVIEKKKNIKSPNVFLNTNVNDSSKFFYPATRVTEKKNPKTLYELMGTIKNLPENN